MSVVVVVSSSSIDLYSVSHVAGLTAELAGVALVHCRYVS